jgi:hypothetical protein
MGPEIAGDVTVMVIVPVAPCAIVPVSEQVTVTVPEQAHPAEPLEDTKTVPVGIVSVTCTVVAEEACPRFWTWIV